MTRGEALEALGLDPDADQDTIRSAYRRLCLKLHPDMFPDPRAKREATSAFLRVRDAYEFFKKNRSLFRAAPGVARNWRAEEDEEWHREMEALLRRRHQEQTARGVPSWAQGMADWWEKLGEAKTRTALNIALSALILSPLAFVLGAEYWRIFVRSLSWGDVAGGILFLVLCRSVARGISSRER